MAENLRKYMLEYRDKLIDIFEEKHAQWNTSYMSITVRCSIWGEKINLKHIQGEKDIRVYTNYATERRMDEINYPDWIYTPILCKYGGKILKRLPKEIDKINEEKNSLGKEKIKQKQKYLKEIKRWI